MKSNKDCGCSIVWIILISTAIFIELENILMKSSVHPDEPVTHPVSKLVNVKLYENALRKWKIPQR